MNNDFISIKQCEVDDIIIFTDTTLKVTRVNKIGIYVLNLKTQVEQFQHYEFKNFLTGIVEDNGWEGPIKFIKSFNRELESL